jgi:hypothetical protein
MSVYSHLDARTLSHAEYQLAKAALLSGRPYVPQNVSTIPHGDVRGLSSADYAAAKEAVIAASYQSVSTPADMPAPAPVEAPQTGAETGTTASTARAPAPISYGVTGRTALHVSKSEYAAALAALLAANH